MPTPPSPFSLGRSIHNPLPQRDIYAILNRPDDRAHRMPVGVAGRLAEQISSVTDVALAVQRALRLTVLGIDYRRYHRFQQLTPYVFQTMDGTVHRRYAEDCAPTQEDFDYCQQFVITVALHLAEL